MITVVDNLQGTGLSNVMTDVIKVLPRVLTRVTPEHTDLKPW